MRSILGVLAGLTLTAASLAAPPNVVLIYADDLGYADLGCYGAKGWTTPNLDQLAKDGVRFTDFHVSQPVCSASRTSLLTGCYANRLGIHGALGPKATHGIADSETTLGELFKSKGYATGMAGKWHLGHHEKFLPTKHGFDSYLGLPYSNDMWPHHPEKVQFPPLPLIDGTKVVNADVTAEFQPKLTTLYTERAVQFIGDNKAKPFFLYLAHSMPHVPLFVSDKFKGKSAQGLYGDVIQEVDWSVGEVLAALKKHGLEDNTLVIFTSDNGPWLSYGNHAGTKGPLREGKGSVWEGGVRVPCVARWPGKIPAGSVQTDIKSALSFASLTQVGLIVAEIGLGLRYVALVHLLGHACLRTLQFLRAPTLLQDYRQLENAIGARLPRPGISWIKLVPESARLWFYRFALERGYLDAALDRYLVGPFVRLFRWCDDLEQRATSSLVREAVEPASNEVEAVREVEHAR